MVVVLRIAGLRVQQRFPRNDNRHEPSRGRVPTNWPALFRGVFRANEGTHE